MLRLLLSSDDKDLVEEIVEANNFFLPAHQAIFRAIKNLSAKGIPVDAITVNDELVRTHMDQQVGGVLYLNSLAQYVPSAKNMVAYANMVREAAMRRKIIAAAETAIQDALTKGGKSAAVIAEELEKNALSINSKVDQTECATMAQDAVRQFLAKLEHRASNPGALEGVPTGYTPLDEMTSGLKDGDLVVLAARPSMGKTTFALNIAENVAIAQKLPVLMFSLEMSTAQVKERMVSALSMVDSSRIRSGELSPQERSEVTEASEQIAASKLFIIDSHNLTSSEMRREARRCARSNGKLGLIMVDYLQLIGGSIESSKDENRATELGEICRSLKMLAKELQCPVIALSQLNRSVETRTDRRPIMTDLRDSGAIEQDADVIMFIYRDEYYNKETTEPGIAEIIIGKQRNGRTGTIKLGFSNSKTRFMDAACTSPALYR